MQGERKFSHITVTPDEEDDVVIQAGVPIEDWNGAADEGPGGDFGESPNDNPDKSLDDALGGDLEEGAAAEPDDVFAGEALGESVSENSPSAPEEAAAPNAAEEDAPQRKAARKEAYRETTMEDLEGAHMSGMQKAIIVLALLLIVAAIVYYCVVMR